MRKIGFTVILGVICVASTVLLINQDNTKADPEEHIEVAVVSEVTSTPTVKETTPEPYDTVSEDWGEDDGFTYYEIPKRYKDAGGEFPEKVQRYLWGLCEEKDLNYYLVVAMIENESGYRYDCLGDDGNSLGYMQIYKKYHTKRMEKENVTDLYDPYGNMRVGTTFLQELFNKYGDSGDNCVLMVYNMGSGEANKLWRKGIYSSEYSREIIERSKEIEQELTQD